MGRGIVKKELVRRLRPSILRKQVQMISTHWPMTAKIFALVAGIVVLTPAVAQSQFNPPRVMLVLNKHNPGDLPEDVASNRSCYIDMGREASIHRGDELNV